MQNKIYKYLWAQFGASIDMLEKEVQEHKTGLEIAVIGMAARFPGARNIDEFWDN